MFDETIAYFRYAIRLIPNYFDAHYNLLRAFIQKKHERNAEEEYKHLIRINPEAAKRLLATLRGNAH